MKLYYHPLSGHSHRVRLFLSLLGIEHELVEVDLVKGQQKSAEFLQLNPLGQVPVLDDAGVVLADSNSILVYLAKKYGRTDWLPETPVGAARVQRWLSIAAGEVAHGPAAARLITVFGAPWRAEEVIAKAHAILGHLENALAGGGWLVGEQPTLADVALYSYVSHAPEGNVGLADYPAVRGWIKRAEAWPGFVEFRRTEVGLLTA